MKIIDIEDVGSSEYKIATISNGRRFALTGAGLIPNQGRYEPGPDPFTNEMIERNFQDFKYRQANKTTDIPAI